MATSVIKSRTILGRRRRTLETGLWNTYSYHSVYPLWYSKAGSSSPRRMGPCSFLFQFLFEAKKLGFLLKLAVFVVGNEPHTLHLSIQNTHRASSQVKTTRLITPLRVYQTSPILSTQLNFHPTGISANSSPIHHTTMNTITHSFFSSHSQTHSPSLTNTSLPLQLPPKGQIYHTQ